MCPPIWISSAGIFPITRCCRASSSWRRSPNALPSRCCNRPSCAAASAFSPAKFRRQVAPGETVTLRATIVKSSRRLVVAEVEASVDGEVCATATQKYVLAPKE